METDSCYGNLQFIARPTTIQVYEEVSGRKKLGPTKRFPNDWTNGHSEKNQRYKLLNLKNESIRQCLLLLHTNIL